MRRIPVFLACACIMISSMNACNNDSADYIIADHNAVNNYNRIPQKYIDTVKTWLIDIAGESHSSGYRIGINLLATQNSKFAAQSFDGSMPAVTSDNLRLGRHGSVGEEDFFTNTAAIDTIKNLIKNQHDAGNPIHVLGFGWCWDMTADHAPSTTRDPVYNVGWAGRTAGGPEGNLAWGLDSDDFSITNNSICMDTYLAAVDSYNAYCKANGYACEVIFTTGPVDGNGGTENGFQREIKHDYMRKYVKDSGGILFDYADILCYNNSDVKNITNWNDSGTIRPHANIHPDNMMDYDENWNTIAHSEDGDHIGEVGTLRIAKAMWWLLARMAGWDGN